MKIFLKDFIKYDLDEEKKASLTIFDRYFYRPIANFILPVLFNVFKLSPNSISILSLLIAIFGFTLIIINIGLSSLYGVILLMTWAVLDCADGSLARVLYYKYNYKNPLGEFFDAFAGYGVIAGMWLSLGWLAFELNDDIRLFFIGALSSILGLLSRVSFNKLALVKLGNNINETQNS